MSYRSFNYITSFFKLLDTIYIAPNPRSYKTASTKLFKRRIFDKKVTIGFYIRDAYNE